MHSFTSSGTTSLWNGGICPTCGAQHLGSHVCTHDDIVRRINELMRLLGSLTTPRTMTQDRTAGCPCRPENGGSGLCGCILSGPTVTC